MFQIKNKGVSSGLAICVFGLIFIGLSVAGWPSSKPLSWTPVTATVQSIQVYEYLKRQHPLEGKIKVQFNWNGNLTSATYSKPPSLTYQKAYGSYGVGDSAIAMVNPRNHTQVVFDIISEFKLKKFLLGIVAVVLGLVMAYRAHTRNSRSRFAAHSIGVSRFRHPAFVIFLLVEIPCQLIFTIRPLYNYFQTKDWEAVNGIIENSWVREYKNDNSTNYRIYPLVSFRVDGNTYKTNSVSHSANPSYHSAQAASDALQHFRIGQEQLIYYDKNNPRRAVILNETPTLASSLVMSALITGTGLYLWWLASGPLKTKSKLKGRVSLAPVRSYFSFRMYLGGFLLFAAVSAFFGGAPYYISLGLVCFAVVALGSIFCRRSRTSVTCVNGTPTMFSKAKLEFVFNSRPKRLNLALVLRELSYKGESRQNLEVKRVEVENQGQYADRAEIEINIDSRFRPSFKYSTAELRWELSVSTDGGTTYEKFDFPISCN